MSTMNKNNEMEAKTENVNDDVMAAETAETAETVDTGTKKRRGRGAKPAVTLSDAFRMFDSGEIQAFSAEYGKDKLKAIILNLNGSPAALAPADAGSGYISQDYEKCRNTLDIINTAYPVSVKVI